MGFMAVLYKTHSRNTFFTIVYPFSHPSNLSWLQKLQFLSKPDLAALWFMKAVSLVVLLVKSIQRRLGLLLILYGAVGHCVGHDADLAQEDLPEEEINPWVQDLVEGGQADRRQEKVTV